MVNSRSLKTPIFGPRYREVGGPTYLCSHITSLIQVDVGTSPSPSPLHPQKYIENVFSDFVSTNRLKISSIPLNVRTHIGPEIHSKDVGSKGIYYRGF